MHPVWAVLVYASAALLAFSLLYIFQHRAWYWHAISVLAALAVGLTPPPADWSAPEYDLTVGFLFILLLLWGIGAPFFPGPRHRHPPQHRHA